MFEILKKDLKDIMKERTFLSTIGLQIFLVAFYSFALFGILVVVNPQAIDHGRADIMVLYENEYPWNLEQTLKDELGFRVHIKQYEPHLVDNNMDATVVIDEQKDEYNVTFYVYDVYVDPSAPKTTYLLSKLKGIFTKVEDQLRGGWLNPELAQLSYFTRWMWDGIDMDRMTVRKLIFEFTYLVLVPILLLLPLYLGSTLLVDLISEEITSGTLSMLLSAPTTFIQILINKMLASTILTVLQFSAWMYLLQWKGIALENDGLIWLILFLLNLVFLLGSALITVLVRDRVNAQLILSLFLLFFLMTKSVAYNPIDFITKLAINVGLTYNIVGIYCSILALIAGTLWAILANRCKNFEMA